MINKNQLKTIFFTIVLCAYFWLIIKFSSQITTAILENYKIIVLSIGFIVLGISIQSANYLGILNHNNKIKVVPTIKIWAIANLTNYIAPFQPGLLVRAKYFKNLGVSYKNSSIAVVKQIHYNVWIGLGLVVLALPDNNKDLSLLKIVLGLIFIIWPFALRLTRRWASSIFSLKYHEHINKIFDYPRSKQIILCALHYLVISAMLYFVIKDFGIEVTLTESILLSTALIISSLAAITPNNLGIQEIIIGSFIFIHEPSNYQYITIPFILRLSHITACTILWLLISYIIRVTNNYNDAK